MPKTMLPLDRLATPVDVAPGGEVILRGALVSTHDGSTLDAATSSSADGEGDGGAGLVDFEAGGFHLISRDAALHEVHAIATGGDAPACHARGVSAPCLPLRYEVEAHRRLLTVDDWVSSLKGGISIETTTPPVYAPVAAEAWLHASDIGAGALVAVIVFGVLATLRRRRRFAASPAGQLLAAAQRIDGKLTDADPIVAAPLRPAIVSAARAIRSRRLDPATPEGRRIAEVLARVEQRLDDARAEASAGERKAITDALVRDIDAAIEASDEVLEHRDRPAPAA